MRQPFKSLSSFLCLLRAGGWLFLVLLFGRAIPVRALDLATNAPATNTASGWMLDATNHLGSWIWDTNTFDKQTVLLLKTFDIPAGSKVTSAIIHITVDNSFTLYIDGEEIGRGSDWRTVTIYDVTELLTPGRHILGVEAFNDRLAGGLIFGLHITLASQRVMDIPSDASWLVGAGDGKRWSGDSLDPAIRHPARVEGSIHTHPWENWPIGVATVPRIHPRLVHFWERGWFELALFCTAAAALLFSLWLMAQLAAQGRAQKFLQVERVRIARDIHDDLGAQLTQLLLQGEVAQREQPEASPARAQFRQLCDRARELAQAMDEVVWAVNSRRDTVRDFASHVCKYAQNFLGAAGIRCRLDVEPEIPASAFDLPLRRNLFLAVKEALNNAAKYSGVGEMFLRIHQQGQKLSVTVEDNGRGFDPAATGAGRNGLANMTQRMAEIGGACDVVSRPGGGCRVVFTVPLPAARRSWLARAARDREAADKIG